MLTISHHGSKSNSQTPNNVYISGSITKMSAITIFHQWIINSYSDQSKLLSTGRCLTSKEFGNENVKFQLKLYPNGKDSDSENDLALFLIYKSGSCGKINLKIELSLQTENGKIECPTSQSILLMPNKDVATAFKFFSHNQMQTNDNLIFPNDILRINVNLKMMKATLSHEDIENCMEDYLIKINAPKYISAILYENVSPSRKGLLRNCSSDIVSFIPVFKDDRLECVKDVSELLTGGKFYDFNIVTSEGEKISVHKAILSARCSYFEAFFDHSELKEITEGFVKYDDLTKETMWSILKYIYGIPLDACEKNMKVFAAADRFQLSDLKDISEQELVKSVNEKNVCDLLSFGQQFKASKLTRRCISCINKHAISILKSEHWSSFETKEPAVAAKVLRKIVLFSEKGYKDGQFTSKRTYSQANVDATK